MDSFLLFPLILAFLCTGQSQTSNKVTESICDALCPAGYYKVGSCSDTQYRCEKCENGSYTDQRSATPKCLRCKACEHDETKTKPCSFDSNAICECKEGLWREGERCKPCPCRFRKETGKEDFYKKQQENCLRNPACKEKCEVAVLSPQCTKVNITTTTSATPSVTPTAKGPTLSTTPNPVFTKVPLPTADQTPSLFLVVVVVTFLVLFCLMLLCASSPIRYPDCRPCCHANKEVEPPIEDPIFNEQRSHRGSSPTTLILNISEETPMMNLSQSPAPPEHPVHTGPVLPDTKHKGARQEEQSEQWPAIVLYAIIKEVPLRRWKEFLRLLSVADQQLERVELEASLGQGFMERQYQMLRLWSQRSTSSLNDVFSALHYMDLSGCAQLLQESLEKLQWRPELK